MYMMDWLQAMPKAELHLHLDGGLRVETALDLAEKSGWRDFAHPLSYRQMRQKMVVKGTLSSQRELLDYFQIPGLLLQTEDALCRATYELLEDKAADGVRYCEIRWAPLLHTRRGLSVRRVVEAVLAGRQKAARLLGVHSRLIVVGMRGMAPRDNLDMLEEVRAYRRRGIAAADLAGVEEDHPDPLDQLAYFHRARELGLGVTFHCGETAQSIRYLEKAVERIRPRRVAHGAVVAADAALCALLRKRRVTLDLCPTSNIQAGLYPDYPSFPLERLYRSGVPVSISTDDPVLSDVTLTGEYSAVLSAGGLKPDQLWSCNLHALRAGFMGYYEKQALLREFQRWRSQNPPQNPVE